MGVGTGFVISVIVVSLLFIAPAVSAGLPESIQNGPYIDTLVYKVIAGQDQRILALQAGEIEMDSTYYDPYYTSPSSLAALEADPDIDIAQTLKNGYTYASFDCEQYPGNISGFRRAFAYALNKTKVVNDVMNGYAEAHDSVVPYQNQFCIEDDLDYHYYDSRLDLGNAILDNLGFAINPDTGLREAPNGNPVHILILYGMGTEKYDRIADICLEAFASLNISASSTAPCGCELNEEMTIWMETFYDSDLSWLANYYWSGYTDDYHVATGFSNTTFDSWRDQLLYSTLYEDTMEAASEMQKILHYNVPLIPIYQDINLHPYRNDQFGGHIEDSVNSVFGPWTMLNIRRVDGTSGGTVPIGINYEPNFSFWSGESGHWLLTNMHCAMYTKDPDQLPYPQLAESMKVETHADNPSVIDGNTRFTFEIRSDMRWTDGVPVTADDVLFTLNYTMYGTTELSAVYSPRPDVVVVEFSTKSYWLFDRFAYSFIAPKHIFENYEQEEWASLNLMTINDGNSLNCGPFMLTDFEEGEFYELAPRYQYSWPGDEETNAILVALLQPMNDTQVMSPSFTLRWILEWEFQEFDNVAAEKGRFDLEYTLIRSSYSYTVFLDGENYSLGTSDSGYIWYDFIDVMIEVPFLSVGQHNVTLVLNNGYYTPQVDTVMVTVLFPITFTGVLMITSVSVIGIASLAIIWHFKLRRSQPQHLGS